MARNNDAEFGEFTDAQLDTIAKHAAKGFMAEMDGKKSEANAHYRRAKVATDTAKLSNKAKKK